MAVQETEQKRDFVVESENSIFLTEDTNKYILGLVFCWKDV